MCRSVNDAKHLVNSEAWDAMAEDFVKNRESSSYSSNQTKIAGLSDSYRDSRSSEDDDVRRSLSFISLENGGAEQYTASGNRSKRQGGGGINWLGVVKVCRNNSLVCIPINFLFF